MPPSAALPPVWLEAGASTHYNSILVYVCILHLPSVSGRGSAWPAPSTSVTVSGVPFVRPAPYLLVYSAHRIPFRPRSHLDGAVRLGPLSVQPAPYLLVCSAPHLGLPGPEAPVCGVVRVVSSDRIWRPPIRTPGFRFVLHVARVPPERNSFDLIC